MKVLATIFAAALAICGTASAQTDPEIVKVHFDQPVMVAHAQLPGGDYTIQELDDIGGEVVLVIRSQSGPQAAVLVNRITAPEGPDGTGASVILSHTEAGYRLHRVWLTPDSGFEILQ